MREYKEKGEDKKYGCWFYDWCKVFMNFLDGRPRMRKNHYFEDVCVRISGATLIRDDGRHLMLSLNTEMIAANSMFFSA